jgi:hypothetical protein
MLFIIFQNSPYEDKELAPHYRFRCTNCQLKPNKTPS